ncbi:hypothetical protein INP75_31290 [Bacillus toyonensis]|nr:hypothetical protein [Bacillus toyonensis]
MIQYVPFVPIGAVIPNEIGLDIVAETENPDGTGPKLVVIVAGGGVGFELVIIPVTAAALVAELKISNVPSKKSPAGAVHTI